MKKKVSILLLTILTATIYSCNQSGPQNETTGTATEETTQQNQTTENQSDKKANSSSENYDELIGGYAFERNGQVQLKILNEGSNYYLQFPGSNSKEPMSVISESNCSRILGSNWRDILISGLHSGAFFVFKVKTGSNIMGMNISSGFFGAIPGAGEIWKVN